MEVPEGDLEKGRQRLRKEKENLQKTRVRDPEEVQAPREGGWVGKTQRKQQVERIKRGGRPGAVAHTCNPSTSGGRVGRIT